MKIHTINVPKRALACLMLANRGWIIPCMSGFLCHEASKNVANFNRPHRLSMETIPSGKSLLEGILKTERTEAIDIPTEDEAAEKLAEVAGRLQIPVEDLLLSLVAYNLWVAEEGSDSPLLQIEAPKPKRETLIDRFADALHRDTIAERAAEREASKLHPLTIVISDQQELKRIYELAKDSTSKPVAFLRRHIRVSVRELAARH